MKKLMIAGVVGLCAAVTFGLESANVVGYQNKEITAGFNFVAPTFLPVDSSGMINIQDIKLDATTAESWSDNLQILDEGGATISTYGYATAEESGFSKDGWLDEEGNYAEKVTVPYGAGILIDSANNSSVTFSGQVSDTESTITGVAGFNFTGNNTPAEIDIQDIKLDATTAESWSDNLQILDEGGATIATYGFATAEESGFEKDGWLDGDGNYAEKVKIAPGQGVLIDLANEGTIITIPAAL